MYSALMSLSRAKREADSIGIGRRFKVYDNKMRHIEYDIQVDLI
jgi:hypothetical protein